MIATIGCDATGEKPAAVLETNGLRILFFRRRDRYAHRIETWNSQENGWSIALESREGTDEEPWPPSPPFQQLHVEKRPGGDVVLLVGMAGRSHWSAAVEVCDVRKVLKFDVAVRIQTGPVHLGSAYVICADGAAGRLVAQKESGTEIGVGFTFGPERFADSPPPATICWKYSLGVRDGGG